MSGFYIIPFGINYSMHYYNNNNNNDNDELQTWCSNTAGNKKYKFIYKILFALWLQSALLCFKTYALKHLFHNVYELLRTQSMDRT